MSLTCIVCLTDMKKDSTLLCCGAQLCKSCCKKINDHASSNGIHASCPHCRSALSKPLTTPGGKHRSAKARKDRRVEDLSAGQVTITRRRLASSAAINTTCKRCLTEPCVLTSACCRVDYCRDCWDIVDIKQNTCLWCSESTSVDLTA